MPSSALLSLTPPLICLVLRALSCTWSYRVAGWQRLARLLATGEPIASGMFHGHQLCLLGYFARPNRGRWTMMVSRSRDGELQHQVLRYLGFDSVRGSTGRGGSQALLTLVQQLRQGRHPHACLAMDGSRGPGYQAKVGILALAAKGQAWLVIVRAEARRAWILQRSWDRLRIPLPWSSIDIVCSLPIRLPADLSPAAIQALQPRLQALAERQQRWLAQQAHGWR